jgi:hypothetical protein
MAIGAVHLAGLALAAWALCIALRRCYRERESVVTGLAVAVILVTAAYLFSLRSASFLGLREMAGVLPMTAVLAGRLLPGRLAAAMQTGKPAIRRLAASGLMIVMLLAGVFYAANLAYNATRPSVPAQYHPITGWLAAHHLSYGLGGYWQADSITLDSAGRIRVRAVFLQGSQTAAGQWETRESWYDPRPHNADLAVVSPGASGLRLAAPTAAFGPGPLLPCRRLHGAGLAQESADRATPMELRAARPRLPAGSPTIPRRLLRGSCARPRSCDRRAH